MGARVNGIHEVTGSIPVWSTNPRFCSVWLDQTVVRQIGIAFGSPYRHDPGLVQQPHPYPGPSTC